MPDSRIAILTKAETVGAVQMRKILLKARDRMERTIIKHAMKKNFGTSALVRDQMYLALKADYVGLNGSLQVWESTRIKSVARQWRKLAINDLPSGTYDQTWAKFSRKYVNDMVTRIGPVNAPRLAAVNSQLGGMLVNDVRMLRGAVVDTLREASLTGMNAGQITRTMRDKVLQTKPEWQFIDKGGKRWDTNKYFKMVNKTIHTNTARASYIDTITEAGYDLATIDGSIAGDCEACKKWVGRTVSVTGNDSNYPSLDEAYGDGVFHPNCVHYVSVILPGDEKKEEDSE